jgi:hypothetical protein
MSGPAQAPPRSIDSRALCGRRNSDGLNCRLSLNGNRVRGHFEIWLRQDCFECAPLRFHADVGVSVCGDRRDASELRDRDSHLSERDGCRGRQYGQFDRILDSTNRSLECKRRVEPVQPHATGTRGCCCSIAPGYLSRASRVRPATLRSANYRRSAAGVTGHARATPVASNSC